MNTQVKERIKRAFIYAGAVIALVVASIFLYNHTRNTYLFCSTIWQTGFYMEIDRPSSVKIYDNEFFSDGCMAHQVWWFGILRLWNFYIGKAKTTGRSISLWRSKVGSKHLKIRWNRQRPVCKLQNNKKTKEKKITVWSMDYVHVTLNF